MTKETGSKNSRPFARGIPESYEALCRVQLPRPIRDEEGYENALGIIDALAGHKLSKEQEDYLEAISLFVHEYEQAGLEDPQVEPLEVLAHLLEENGLRTKELAQILEVDFSTAARLLKGTRSITPAHARRLGQRFQVRPGLFLGIK